MSISTDQQDSLSGIHAIQDGQKETAEENFSPAAQIRAISGKPVKAATLSEYWHGLCEAVVEQLADDWHETNMLYQQGRMQHYFSSEFLMGRSLENNLVNLDLYETAKKHTKMHGQTLSDILEAEPDANLGNGGLGRLAACFLDSCASLNLPVQGYGILYRYGLFRQIFEDRFQVEHPEPWMEEGYPFVIRREEETKTVHFRNMSVHAVPYDMPITGYGTDNINTLRLWKAESPTPFSYELFNEQKFAEAVAEREKAADISRVLYPNDSTYSGKLLRLSQQYFFVSASLQCIVGNYTARHGNDFNDFSALNCIQLNDTHPVLAIPELLRLLLDEHSLQWEEAWKIVNATFAYTNHTTLPEALESWDISLFAELFPRLLEIIREIDRRLRAELTSRHEHPGKIDYMTPITQMRINMAWIACYASYSINGVAAMHTEIIKNRTLKDWYSIWPEKFNNKTNGVTPRRWLRLCNPDLAALLTELTGNQNWVTDLDILKTLEKYKDDASVLGRLSDIKLANKQRFAAWLERSQGVRIRTDAVYDVQVKRLHEYKRQLMNALYILDLYYRIKEGAVTKPVPRVFIFGAKAAPGYYLAKAIIKLINEIALLVNSDEATKGILQLVFIENYNVSAAEHIIPATDISEQISLAGKEASGTGNMKFMMNGALTLGTYDGANVEIVDAVGYEHVYIFGAREEALRELRKNYDPKRCLDEVPGLKRAVDAISSGVLDDGRTGMFADLKASLLEGDLRYRDPYYVLGDFAAYRETRDQMALDYLDRETWNRSCWLNIIHSGRFSSDRTMRDYNQDIWHLEPTAIKPGKSTRGSSPGLDKD